MTDGIPLTSFSPAARHHPSSRTLSLLRRRLSLPRLSHVAFGPHTYAIALGIAHMFQTLTNHPQIMIHVFRERTDAFNWIRAPEATATAP
jgi:hypothetical protein